MEQARKRLNRRLAELAAWQTIDRSPLAGQFQAPGTTSQPIQTGQDWPSTASPVWMRFRAKVPERWAGHPVLVHLAPGGEGLLLVDGKARGGLNRHHQRYPLLEEAEGGESLTLEVEAVPHAPFGEPIRHPRLEAAYLAVPDLDVHALWHDLAAALDAAGHVEEEVATLLLDAVSSTFAALRLPKSPLESYLARVTLAPERFAMVNTLWEDWHITEDPLPLPEEMRPQLRRIHEQFQARVEEIGRRYPPVGQILLTGHAHLDVAWLWPLEETRRKARRTFATVLTLMESYPELTFSQSMAQLYAFVEEEDPDLLAQVRARIEEERWEPVGGTWVEPDGNLLSGESWARQLLYGQRYFESRLGRRATVAWLPDTFGFASNLPQLFLEAGLRLFATTKLNWNETNPFPYDLYRWEGLDGSQILAHTFDNPNHGYNGRVEALDLRETWRNYRGKRHYPRTLLTFGHGDGGGGPTAEMVERYRRFQSFPGLPRLQMGPMEAFGQELDEDDLPTWFGEQYLELHRGTYTTQAQIKALNRSLEHTLTEAETASSLAYLRQKQDYPAQALENCWKTLLRNQFHDILPGSSIHTVIVEAQQELFDTLDRAEALLHRSLKSLSQEIAGHPQASSRVVLWNLSLDDRPLQVVFPRLEKAPFRLLTPIEVEVPYQESAGNILAALDLGVPGLGYTTLSLVPGTPRPVEPGVSITDIADDVRPNVVRMENDYLRVDVAPDGTLASLYDKEIGREALAGRANQLWAYTDHPREWEAWDVDASYLREGQEIVAPEPPDIVETGPVRAGLRTTRRIGHSTIEQCYWLWAGSRRLEIETWIEWSERCTFLRALFPLAVRTHEAWFETAFGTVPRPTHRNTSWDRARFEVPALRFADLSEADYGVSLLNSAKYGHSAHGNVLGLSLLRGPLYPDPLADQGSHHFTYALYPHRGDWRTGTVTQAHNLNTPLRPLLIPGPGGGEMPQRRFLQIDQPALCLSALKRAEDWDGVVLRLYEAHGSRGTARLSTEDLNIGQSWRVNLLEDPRDALALEKGQLQLDFSPFQVLSFILARA